MKKSTIGIIGCGTIGSGIAHAIEKKMGHSVRLAYLADSDAGKATQLRKKCTSRIRIVPIKELIKRSDFIIEAASAAVSYRVVRQALGCHKSVLVMSIGGLTPYSDALLRLLKKTRGTLYLPSGAICGLDGMLAAHCAGIKRVTLTTRKPLRGLLGAPYFERKKMNLEKIKKETVVFNGTAAEAIRYFPKNINVAALLSIAGIGVKRTKVRIITSPTFTRNSHEVCIEGKAGSIITRTENVPSPLNPKTSYLAILSAEALLKKVFSRIRIGT